jgi:hypothetical protein
MRTAFSNKNLYAIALMLELPPRLNPPRSQVQAITESLRKHGVGDDVISSIITEARLKSA